MREKDVYSDYWHMFTSFLPAIQKMDNVGNKVPTLYLCAYVVFPSEINAPQ